MASDTDIAWAAGLFDGEGSTSVLKAQRDKYAYIRMSVSQKDRRVLDKFQSIIGVGRIYKANKRPIHSLDIYKQEDVENTLNLLWPHISELKKEQAIKACTRIYRGV